MLRENGYAKVYLQISSGSNKHFMHKLIPSDDGVNLITFIVLEFAK